MIMQQDATVPVRYVFTVRTVETRADLVFYVYLGRDDDGFYTLNLSFVQLDAGAKDNRLTEGIEIVYRHCR